MDELLFYAKFVLLVVLVYDFVILFRKPEEGSKVVTLDFWKEMERKGINGTLIPCTMIFIISLLSCCKTDESFSSLIFLSRHIYSFERSFRFVLRGSKKYPY